MFAEPEDFVWEVASTTNRERLGDELRARLHGALARARAPLLWLALTLSVFAYMAPLLFLEEPLRDALSQPGVERGTLASWILVGVSTVVISPIWGLFAMAREESNALLSVGRRYSATPIPNRAAEAVRLSLTTADGVFEVDVPELRPDDALGGKWLVYAVPEEASVAVVQVRMGKRDEVRVGHLSRRPV